jgi:hypothetical protein
MTILDNYMFRPLLVIFRLSSRELNVLLYYAVKPGCRDLAIMCAHNTYSRTLSALEDNLKVTSKGRNM